MKSFLSLERPATFTCRKNKVERKYLVWEGEEFVDYDMISEKPTTEENGVLAELKINSWAEKQSFVQKVKQKLAYYDTVIILNEGLPIESTIYREKDFQYSSLNCSSTMHIALKDVYYAIDWEALGIPQINHSIAIRVNLSDGLRPTPSRESYITTDATKKFILGKIATISTWFINKYNTQIKEFNHIIEASKYLGLYEHRVNLSNSTTIEDDRGKNIFRIDELVPYSTVNLNTPKVKGVKNLDLEKLWGYKNSLVDEYDISTYIDDKGKEQKGVRQRRYLSLCDYIFDRKRIVLVDSNFLGNVRTYLKLKYPTSTMFVKRNATIRTDNNSSAFGDYKYILGGGYSTDTKREFDYIVKSIVDTFVDETKVEQSKKFNNWLKDKKDADKLQRAQNKVNGIYNGINKQLGDVTLAYSYSSLRGISFKKQAYPIKDLSKNHYLSILLTEDDDLVKAKLLISGATCPNIKFALVGKNEIKKVPNHYNFIKYNKFMTRDCKPFMRIASSILFQKAIKEIDNIKKYKEGIFSTFFKTFGNDIDILNTYIRKNSHYTNPEMQEMIIDVADTHNLYDKSLWDVYMRVLDATKKYDFVNLLVTPASYDTETIKKYNILIAQLLLFRKKYYNDLPEGATIVVNGTKI